MADKLETRLALLGLASDGSEMQKESRQRVKRSYGHPVSGQESAVSLPLTTNNETASTLTQTQSMPTIQQAGDRIDGVSRTEERGPILDSMAPEPLDHMTMPTISRQPTPTVALGVTTIPMPASSVSANTVSQKMPVVGMPAQPNGTYCALLAISKLPYKFIFDKQLGQVVSVEFFADGKFFRYGWTV